MISFRVVSEDAIRLAPAFSKFPDQLQPQDLTNLPKYTAYVRLLIDGSPSNAFSISTLPPSTENGHREAVVRRTSQRQFANTKSFRKPSVA